MTVAVSAGGTVAAVRGSVDLSASKETLQEGMLHALAAAAGCTLASPKPDVNGIDWNITLHSRAHANVWDATLDVQLKCTHTASPNTTGYFSYTLENDHFEKLACTNIGKPRLLFVMLCPSDVDRWLHSGPNWTLMRHSMYWANLYGMSTTGKTRSNVRIPYANRVDAIELCRLLNVVGNGSKPWAF